MINFLRWLLFRFQRSKRWLLAFCALLLLILPLQAQQQVGSRYYRPGVVQPDSATLSGHLHQRPRQRNILTRVQAFPENYGKKVQSRLAGFNKQLTQRTDKALRRLIKQEESLKQELSGSDKAAADHLFTKGIDSLKRMRAAITSRSTKLANPTSFTGTYFPYMDTLKSSLTFLQQENAIPNTTIKNPAQISEALSQVKATEAKLQYSEKIKSYLMARQHELGQQLAQYTGYDRVKRELDKMKKEAYYYQEQIKGYKEMLSEPSRIEEEATKLLKKLPAFQRFMADNGALAAIFANKNPADLNGLQTRETVEKLIKDQVKLLGPEGSKLLEEHLQETCQALDKLKQQAGGEGDAAIPGFKPNGEKSKSLWQRIEIGTDCQFNRNNNLLPSTGDFGLSIAYHVTKKGAIGIGGAWKAGMGKDINHIRITYEGISMRTFMEYAVWKGIGIRGGWERTFLVRQITTEYLTELKKSSNWQQSALLGISKKMAIPLKMPVLKKKSASGNMQLLYDFLHNNHNPATPALQLRVGMGL
jgi:hypothetical protein